MQVHITVVVPTAAVGIIIIPRDNRSLSWPGKFESGVEALQKMSSSPEELHPGNWIPYSERPEWADVTPLPQVGGRFANVFETQPFFNGNSGRRAESGGSNSIHRPIQGCLRLLQVFLDCSQIWLLSDIGCCQGSVEVWWEIWEGFSTHWGCAGTQSSQLHSLAL